MQVFMLAIESLLTVDGPHDFRPIVYTSHSIYNMQEKMVL